MKLPVLIAASLLCLLSASTHAQTFKCTSADGRVTYSNVACPDSTQSVRPVDTSGNTLDGSSLREKVQKDKADAAQNEARERELAQARALEAIRQEARKAEQNAAAQADCTRDVERTGTDRARQTPPCPGAEVRPETPVVILRPAGRTPAPLRINSCTGNQCSDDAGQRYYKQQGSGLIREDGKACQLTAGNAVRCP